MKKQHKRCKAQKARQRKRREKLRRSKRTTEPVDAREKAQTSWQRWDDKEIERELAPWPDDRKKGREP
jgi:hypothetical protein